MATDGPTALVGGLLMDEFSRARLPVRVALWVGIAVCLAGCESLGTTKKAYNPVVPPPPRTRHVGNADEDENVPVGGDGQLVEKGSRGKASLAAAAPTGAKTVDGAAPDRRTGRGVRSRNAAAPQDDVVAEADGAAADASPQGRPRRPRTPGEWRNPEQSGARIAAQAAHARPARPETDTVSPVAATDEDPGDLTAMKFSSETEGAGTPVKRGEVAATVNGAPIFVDDVLLPIAPIVAEAEKQMPPDQFKVWRARAIAQHLRSHVDHELLVQALKRRLKEDNFKTLNKHIDAEFEKELKDTMKKLDVRTRGELEVKLQKNDSSIEKLQATFVNRHLAQQYLSSRAMPVGGFDRPDVLDHWKSNPETYAVPAEVKWRQIQLRYAQHDGKRATMRLAREICDRLENGEDFGALAKEFSDGPTKASGGLWDWTKGKSLKSKELDRQLFEMPVLEEIAMVEGPDAVDIVLVVDRHEAGYKAFESVQGDIKLKLKTDEFNRTVQSVLDELAEKATIEYHAGQL